MDPILSTKSSNLIGIILLQGPNWAAVDDHAELDRQPFQGTEV